MSVTVSLLDGMRERSEPPTLLLITGQLLYGEFHNFLSDEIPYLAKAFERVVVLPMSEAKGTEALPQNVECSKTLIGSSKTRYYLRNLMRPRVILSVLSLLPQQLRKTGLRRRPLMELFIFACHRDALERNPVIEELLRNTGNVVAYAYWGNAAALAVPFLKRHGVKCCVRYHGSDLYDDPLNGNATLPWREEVAAATDLSIFISEHGREYFQRNIRPVDRDGQRTIVSRLGVPKAGNMPEASAGAPLVMVSCAYISRNKRIHLIAAVAKALAEFGAVEWHHFGGGMDKLLARELEKIPPQLVVRMHGTVPNRTVLEFYETNHVDLFLNMSVSEGIPVSAMEAISYGVPVVAPNITGLPELAVPSRSGLVIDEDECLRPELVAQRISQELTAGGRLSAARPREVWAERFDREQNYRTFAETLRSQLSCA